MHRSAEAVVPYHASTRRVDKRVVRERVGDREASFFMWIGLIDGLYAPHTVKQIQRWYRKSVPDDGKQNKPVDNRNHSSEEVLFLRCLGFSTFWEKMTGMFYIEHCSDSWCLLLAMFSCRTDTQHLPIGPK